MLKRQSNLLIGIAVATAVNCISSCCYLEPPIDVKFKMPGSYTTLLKPGNCFVWRFHRWRSKNVSSAQGLGELSITRSGAGMKPSLKFSTKLAQRLKADGSSETTTEFDTDNIAGNIVAVLEIEATGDYIIKSSDECVYSFVPRRRVYAAYSSYEYYDGLEDESSFQKQAPSPKESTIKSTTK